MKYLFCLIFLLMFNYSICGQEKFERFTINFGLTLPVYNAPNTVDEFTIVPEIELLLNLPLFKTTILSTGIGIESGKHIVVEDYSHLGWVNDEIGWRPYKGRHYWNLDFLNIKMPVYVSVPLNNSFLDSFTFGSGLGWLLSYKLTEGQIPNTSSIKINRSFLDLSLGVKKKLFQFNQVSLSCTPGIGFRTYLTHRNDWQNKCFLGELKFNINF
ncbi:MAG: hypothetical protein Q8T08_08130 [Ignavibacteria bacterium]|nr:hypothetical protein [Ignavibacteria bacterium]